MTQQKTTIPGIAIVLTAHEGLEGRLLLAELRADEVVTATASPAKVAVVLDRSGSMGGRKLQIAVEALARLIRSLRPDDRIAVVTYDDAVDVLSPLAAPSEALARAVERVCEGGSTNLYGGWVKGAKLVGPGGRVILLSDGLANVGRFTDAAHLAQHAGISFEKYRVTTTTIGIGEDYDEALMAGMARAGGGSHYFAHSVESIAEALAQERFSIGAVALSHVSLRLDGVTRQLGHLWSGESKRSVFRVRDLGGKPMTVRYTHPERGETLTETLAMPSVFGHSNEATLELLIEEAGDAETTAASVRNPESAGAARAEVRRVLLRVLAHPLADSELALAVRASLEGTLDRLERLERNYDEETASLHRKRSFQSGHNLRERAKAYSSFEEDQVTTMRFSQTTMAASEPLEFKADSAALALAPLRDWLAWPALPIGVRGELLTVLLPNIKDGFVIAEIEKATGKRVRALVQMPASEIRALLES